MVLLGARYPLVMELIAPVNAHEVPRPRSAGLEPPRHPVNVFQKVDKSAFAIMPELFTYDDQGLPVAFMP